MDIKIDQAALQEVVKAAIFEQLGAEGRERLVEAALSYLLTTPKSSGALGYGVATTSPLQQAFNDAAAVAAQKIVMDEVAKDPVFIDKVKARVAEAMALIDEMDFTDTLAQGLVQALRRKR